MPSLTPRPARRIALPDSRIDIRVAGGGGRLATAVAEGIPLTVILVDNQGYMSIGALSRSLGQAGFGTHCKRAANGGPILDTPDGAGLATAAERLPVDFAASAPSLGAEVIRAETVAQLRAALSNTAEAAGPVVICAKDRSV